jgi:hypothetical protein
MSTRTILIIAAALVIFAIGGVVGCQAHAHFNPVDAVPLIGKSDTIVKRDTIRVVIKEPAKVEDAGTISVTPHKASDTVKIASNTNNGGNVPRETIKDDKPILQPSGNIDIPITRKTYSGPDFYAVVSGWRPSLDSLQVFPKITTITNIQPVRKRSVISITVGPTALYDGKQLRSGIGVTAGFTILAR